MIKISLPVKAPDPIRAGVGGEAGFPFVAHELDPFRLAALGNLGCKVIGVGDDEDLRIDCRSGDEPGERRQQFGMEAGFRFVENHQGRRFRSEQCGANAKEPQGAIREFGRREPALQIIAKHVDSI